MMMIIFWEMVLIRATWRHLPEDYHHQIQFYLTMQSRYSDDLQAERPGFNSQKGQDFSLLHSVQTESEAPPQPPIQCVLGALSSGIKRKGREANHSPPFCSEIKNGGAIPSCLQGSVLNKLSIGTALPYLTTLLVH
jgi:hypothetical protein